MAENGGKLTRIGVFYDGNFFFHVSNYYQYTHSRKARISVGGFHEFIRHQVAESEGSDVKYCQIVDAHYFRGRPRALDAEQKGSLFRERQFDDVLNREGVVTHYLPLGPEGEKGIDVWLALEAYELAIYKRFDVSVLVACDGDFLPLVRKMNTLGTRVMLTAWDFEFTDQYNQKRTTKTAQVLLDEVTYPVMMHSVIDDRSKRNDTLVNGLFMPSRTSHPVAAAVAVAAGAKEPAISNATGLPPPQASSELGTIHSLKEGYGFIKPNDGSPTLFFFHAAVNNSDFNDLVTRAPVNFRREKGEKGDIAVDINVQSVGS